jgi:hypothetical protein
MMATQELVVPRSIPITFDIPCTLLDSYDSNVFYQIIDRCHWTGLS